MNTVDRLATPEQFSGYDITKSTTFKIDASSQLGGGSFGDVYKGKYRDRSGRDLDVAVKVLRSTDADRVKIERRLRREIVVWKRLSNSQRNIAHLMGICVIPGKVSVIVSLFVKQNNFLEYISMHPAEQLAKAKDIARGLDHLHGNNVVHGDLKVDNILISDDGNAQLTDFGMSVILEIQGFTTQTNQARNIRFTAPELLPITELPPEIVTIKPTKPSDIFSLGILFLQLFHGAAKSEPYNHMPFSKADPIDSKLLRHIHQRGRPKRERYNRFKDSLWDLIVRCWAADPRVRPTILEIRDDLRAI